MFNSYRDVKPQEGKQKLALQRIKEGVDLVILGGARFGGKSVIGTMIPTMFIDDPEFRGIAFRKTFKQIMGGGGLWDKAKQMYPLFDGIQNKTEMQFKFPSGATMQYSYLDKDGDEENHRGKEYTYILADEIDHLKKESVLFLTSCLRSNAEKESFMVGTLNPNPDSWLLPWLNWYLDEEGYPDPEKAGAVRYFIEKDGDFIFRNTEQEILDEFPEACYIEDHEGNKSYVKPMTFTFVFFNIYDNPIGLKTNERYIQKLNNLPEHQRKAELFGNWYARPKKQSLFHRDHVRGAEGERVLRYTDLPSSYTSYRGWDKAYATPSATNRNPDYTACSPKIIVPPEQDRYILVGDYHPDNTDRHDYKEDETPIMGMFREDSFNRDDLILKQALYDGLDTAVVLSKDSASGTTDHTYTIKKLIADKIQVIEDKLVSNAKDKKVKDFLPFCTAAKAGLVYIVEESFNPETLLNFYKALERFDGTSSGRIVKDDLVDAMSIAFDAAVRNENSYTHVDFVTLDFVSHNNHRMITRFRK